MQLSTTKDLILEKTFHLLLAKGYDGVSISDIQKTTGIARGLLYHYFGNKEELFIEVTQKYFVNLFGVELKLIQEYDIKQMIDYICIKYDEIFLNTDTFESGTEKINIMNYDFLFYQVIKRSETFAAKYAEVRKTELKAWEIVLENTRKTNLLRDDINSKKTAQYYIYLIDGVWMNAVNKHDSSALTKDLREVLNDFYDLIKK